MIGSDEELQQFLDKTAKLDIFTITKTDEKGKPEDIDFTRKFWDYLLGPGLEWVQENKANAIPQYYNDVRVLRLGMMLMIVAKYLGLDNEEKSRRINELLPIANAVLRCIEASHFKTLWK